MLTIALYLVLCVIKLTFELFLLDTPNYAAATVNYHLHKTCDTAAYIPNNHTYHYPILHWLFDSM